MTQDAKATILQIAKIEERLLGIQSDPTYWPLTSEEQANHIRWFYSSMLEATKTKGWLELRMLATLDEYLKLEKKP